MEFMNNFEATLLISPDLTVKKIESIEKFFEDDVKSLGGSIIAKENWGLRDLSYKINNAKKALYSFYHMTFEGSEIHKLKKNLSQNEKILRYLIIKVKEHGELPTKLIENNE